MCVCVCVCGASWQCARHKYGWAILITAVLSSTAALLPTPNASPTRFSQSARTSRCRLRTSRSMASSVFSGTSALFRERAWWCSCSAFIRRCGMGTYPPLHVRRAWACSSPISSAARPRPKRGWRIPWGFTAAPPYPMRMFPLGGRGRNGQESWVVPVVGTRHAAADMCHGPWHHALS